MKKFSVLLVALLIAVGFSACKEKAEEPDTTAPTITILKPAEGTQIVPGASLDLEVAFEDDKELKEWSYALKIKQASKKNTATWELKAADHTASLAGAGETKTAAISAPEDAVFGTYTITVTAVDKTGNSSSATRDFELVPAAK